MAGLRPEQELNIRKKLAQILRNQLNTLVQSRRALELQFNTAGDGLEAAFSRVEEAARSLTTPPPPQPLGGV